MSLFLAQKNRVSLTKTRRSRVLVSGKLPLKKQTLFEGVQKGEVSFQGLVNDILYSLVVECPLAYFYTSTLFLCWFYEAPPHTANVNMTSNETV